MIKNLSDFDFKILLLLILIIPGILPFFRIYLNIQVSAFFTLALFNSIVGYYILGYYMGTKEITLKECIIYSTLSLITLIISVILLIINYKITGNPTTFLDNINLITTILPTIGIFAIVKYLITRKERIKNLKLITLISSSTYGIYLFHRLVIYDLYNFSFMNKIFSINSFLGVLVLDFILFLGLGIFTMILKKTPIVKDFL